MLLVLRRTMADSGAVGRSFRMVVDRVNAAALGRPAVCHCYKTTIDAIANIASFSFFLLLSLTLLDFFV